MKQTASPGPNHRANFGKFTQIEGRVRTVPVAFTQCEEFASARAQSSTASRLAAKGIHAVGPTDEQADIRIGLLRG
jgi:hypothetical protein